jgi:phosphoenolpyruvate carboxylase
VRKLVRRLTFTGVDTLIHSLEQQLYENVFGSKDVKHITAKELLEQLNAIRPL